MGRKQRSVSVLYPEERGDKIKSANKELRSENRQLRKKIKQLESDMKTLERGFSKSSDYIEQKIQDKSVEQVIEMVNNFEYKETEKGRQMSKQKNDTIFMSKNCPDCGTVESEGFSTFDYVKFVVHTCKCGFRTKVAKGEGIERG